MRLRTNSPSCEIAAIHRDRGPHPAESASRSLLDRQEYGIGPDPGVPSGTTVGVLGGKAAMSLLLMRDLVYILMLVLLLIGVIAALAATRSER
jgi:hypothetical protein